MTDIDPKLTAEHPAAPTGHYAHRIVRNGTLGLAALLLNGVCYVVVLAALARAIGKDGIGQFYTMVALTTAVYLIVDAGISTVLTYRVARDTTHSGELIDQAAGLYMVVVFSSAAILLIGGVAWAWIADDGNRVVDFAAAAGTCAAMQVQRFCIGVFRAFEMFHQESASRILQGGVLVVSIVVLTSRGWATVETALLALALSQWVAVVSLLVPLVRRIGVPRIRLSRAVARDWLAHAIPLGIGDVFRELSWQLDTLLLGFLQPSSVVGVYSVAYRPLGPMKWLPQAVLAAAFPAFSRLATEDANELNHVFANSIRLIWIITVPMAVAVFVYAERIVLLIGGPDFKEAVVPLRILIWVTAISYLSIPFRFLFAALGKQMIFARLIILLFMIQIVLEAALIPNWSYFGACAGILSGEIAFLLCSVYVCSRLKVSSIPWEAILLATVGGAVMGALLWTTRGTTLPTLFIVLSASISVYVAICILFRALRVTEVMHLFRALGGFLRSAS
jgi:O-antigen/teichoic acid export membrane protein